jgi:acetolactate synthase I/II/III large subunit
MLTRPEQAAASMAGRYGQVTGRAAVVTATLGPGTINMQLGVADATTNSSPMVAMFAPVTRWSDAVPTAQAIPEMFRKTFQAGRNRTTRRGLPSDPERAL